MAYSKIRPRRSTKTEWNLINPILFEGELGIEYPDSGIGTGLCKFKLGDGFTAWSDLPYAFDAQAASSIYGGTVSSYNPVCIRGGTTAEWEAANPVLELYEITYDSTVNSFKIGDGVSAWSDLEYITSQEEEFDYDFGEEE